MSLEIIIGNHQEEIEIPVSWVIALEGVGMMAAELAGEFGIGDDHPLRHLSTVEVALVDDETSAKVHQDFMGLEGETDVITFHHGEIVIGVEVARRQAEEYGEPFGRELLRYLVHGLLHLAGHDDEDERDRSAMESAQEEIVARLWAGELSARMMRDS